MDSRGSGREPGQSVTGMVGRLVLARGVELAGLVDQLTDPQTLARLSDSDRLEVITASVRLDGWSAARRAQTVAALHASVLAEARADTAELNAHAVTAPRAAELAEDDLQDRQLADRRVAMELSLALGVSFATADRELDLALDLTAHPRLADALTDGRLDVRKARIILEGLTALDTGPQVDPATRAGHQARLTAGLLGPRAAEVSAEEPQYRLFRELARPGVSVWSLPPARLRAIITREAARLDPVYLTQRAAAARAGRRVDYQDHPDTTATLYLHTSTVHAAAAYTNIDTAARAARRHGDPRSLDQLRADITIGWLTEGTHGTLVVRARGAEAEEAADPGHDLGNDSPLELPRPDGPLVHVTVAATTLLGLDEEPATLHGPRGPGPLPAHLAQDLASRAGARWRRLLYDPSSGTATDLTPTYRPRALTHAYVRARDGNQSRFPTSAATRLELDHITPYRHHQPTAGGQTGPANLAAAGKRDHQLKTDHLVQVTGDANQRLTYTTPSGRHYVSYPAAHTDIGRAPPF